MEFPADVVGERSGGEVEVQDESSRESVLAVQTTLQGKFGNTNPHPNSPTREQITRFQPGRKWRGRETGKTAKKLGAGSSATAHHGPLWTIENWIQFSIRVTLT